MHQSKAMVARGDLGAELPIEEVPLLQREYTALPDLDAATSFFGVFDGHGGKVVAKFCAKFLHQQVLKHEAYLAGDIGTAVQKAFFKSIAKGLLA